MPSHLTRHVFRCLLANEPITHAGCVRASAIVVARERPGRHHVHHTKFRIPQRRTLFNFGMVTGQTRDRAAPSLSYTSLDVVADLVRRKRLRARLPTTEDVQAAVSSFLRRANAGKMQMLDTQAELLLQAFRYLTEHADNKDLADGATTIKSTELYQLMSAASMMVFRTTSLLPAHLELIQFMDAAIPDSHETKWQVSTALISVLSDLDRPAEARERLLKTDLARFGTMVDAGGKEAIRTYQSVVRLLAAFARQDSEQDMLDILAMSEKAFSKQKKKEHFGVIINFYIARKNSAQVKHWTDLWLQSNKDLRRMRAKEHDGSDNKHILRAVFQYASQNADTELGRHLVANYPLDVLSRNEFSTDWDEMAAYYFTLNRSIEDMAQRIHLTQKSYPGWSPSIDTINRLLEVAIDVGDPYLAERLIGLGQEHGIRPDARTLTLQMDYRLSVKDTDGALLAYKHLQNEAPQTDGSDVPITNRLVVALCNSGRHDFDTIMNVAADMSDRRAPFSADAVQGLALVHLKRDEVQDVEDLVKTHAPSFASAERASIRKAIKDFAILPDTRASTMWDAYQILRNEFDEMPREERTDIMRACFAKQRTDMAVHVFSHMRMHSREDTYPVAETYVAAFMGSAQTQDNTSLEAFHNQLRLDTVIDITTSMRNSLMIAKLATGEPRACLRLWDDIVDSHEGPSYNSILIALRACQVVFDGPEKSEEIWARLKRNNVELDQKLWAAYIGAVASDGGVGRAVQLLKTAQKASEVEVDTHVLGSIVRVAQRPTDAADVSAWASSEHPEQWDELQRQLQQEGGDRILDLDYDLQP